MSSQVRSFTSRTLSTSEAFGLLASFENVRTVSLRKVEGPLHLRLLSVLPHLTTLRLFAVNLAPLTSNIVLPTLASLSITYTLLDDINARFVLTATSLPSLRALACTSGIYLPPTLLERLDIVQQEETAPLHTGTDPRCLVPIDAVPTGPLALTRFEYLFGMERISQVIPRHLSYQPQMSPMGVIEMGGVAYGAPTFDTLLVHLASPLKPLSLHLSPLYRHLPRQHVPATRAKVDELIAACERNGVYFGWHDSEDSSLVDESFWRYARRVKEQRSTANRR